MPRRKGARLLTTIVMIPLIAVVAVGCLGWFQDQLIFFPEALDEDADLSFTGGKEVFVDAEDGARIHGLLFESGESSRGVVLYFHGNAGNVATWAPVGSRLSGYDVDVFLIDYRTYGKSTGSMSEKGLYRDGIAAYEYLLEAGYKPESIVVHGRSLGSAVATYVAAHHDVAAVVLETPFTSLPELAGDLYPLPFPRRILRYSLDNRERAKLLDEPAWVVHGTADQIVPLEHGREVYTALGNGWKMTIIEGGGHNDLMGFPNYDTDLVRFYDEVLPP